MLTRYPREQKLLTDLDPLADAANLIEALTSTEYVIDVLRSRRGLAVSDALARAAVIVPHVRAALDYIDQASSGPRNVAFLPIYYAMLNLAKANIIAGPKHADLPANRWHGAQYRGYAKRSRSILTEEVTLKRGGAIPLLYETLTATRFPGEQVIRMQDIYPYITDVGGEFHLAASRPARLAALQLSVAKPDDGRSVPIIDFTPIVPGRDVKRRDLRLIINGFTEDKNVKRRLVGRPTAKEIQTFERYRSRLRTFLLYNSGGVMVTPLSSGRLLLPEELPIIVAFFHLSSVVRYKPEFMARLRDSRFWPMLNAARRHCLLKYILLSWSQFHQTSLSFAPASERAGA
jgi:hypothetical protein